MDQFSEIPFGSSTYRETLRLREEVLRQPLGLTLSATDLAGEAQQRHFVLRDEAGQLLASVVIRPTEGDAATLRQMAVVPDGRGRGHGARLIRAVEALLREEGVAAIAMSARQSAIGFYEKLGYRCEGAGYSELGIPHIRMTKAL